MSSYDAFVSAFHDHASRDPNVCVNKGIERRLDELPDPSLEEARSSAAEASSLASQARSLPAEELPFDQALDLELAALMLDAEVQRRSQQLNGKAELTQMPRAGDEIGDGIFLLFSNDPRPAGERLRDITSRIERIPDYLETLLARLDTPVDRWVRMDAEKVAGLPKLFANIASWAQSQRWADCDRLTSAIELGTAALQRYATQLQMLPTTQQLHLSPEVARDIVALRGIELSLEELHAIARDFLHQTRGQLEELGARLTAKYGLPASTSVAELQAHLAKVYRVETEGELTRVLDRYQAERERILAFVRTRALFPIFAEQDMKIIQTPAFMTPSIPAGAMMPPAPFRAGVRTSMVYLTLSQELLDEHTELSIPAMMIHEGIPGHHLQLATAARHPSVIRRHCDANDHAEGWTTMLEDYMLDLGYMGELTDEARFVGKLDLSRIGARVAIDLFFMSGDRGYLDVGVDCDLEPADPFQAAGNLLRAVTGFVPSRVEAELNWYSQERAYPLSYLAGNHLVWKLKREVEAKAAGADAIATDRAFHRLYLESGNMPLSFLRRVLAHEGLL